MCKPTTSDKASTATTSVADNPVTTTSPQTTSKLNGNAAVQNHPIRMEDLYKEYPSFLWGPMVVGTLIYGCTEHIPAVKNYLVANNFEPFGWMSAIQYVIYAIVASYAFHGWCATHAPHKLKIQADRAYQVQPNAMAIRSNAALITELVYAVLPLAPSTSSPLVFAAWGIALSVYWDAHFYVAHRYVHENKKAYVFFHKTHHLCKEPNCFGAYFVTYQSHIILEQMIVIMFALMGIPRNVLMFSLYWGTIGTYVEHSGYELGTMKLPLLPFTFGQLSQAMGFFSSFLFDGVSVAEHDWHHEKFLQNYSLSYKYLDKIFGTYHPGREAGTGNIPKVEKRAE